MFVLTDTIERIDAAVDEILTIKISVNQPFVAVAGPTGKTQASIVTLSRKNRVFVYMCFYNMSENVRLFFHNEKGPVKPSRKESLEKEAVQFLENMGFIIIDSNFRNLSDTEKQDVLDNSFPFVEDLSVSVPESTDSPDEEDEYEEVIEEVYEEVYMGEGEEDEVGEDGDGGLDERDDRAEHDDVNERYESLDDIVEEQRQEQEQYESLDDVVREAQGESEPQKTEDEAVEEAEKTSLDLTDEIGEVVASINNEKDTETEEISFGSAQPDETASREEEKTTADVGTDGVGEPRFSVDDRLKPFVNLLTSL
ncbi:MAG: hypothetical protein JW885_00360 [Deltaproteobacteria bacterium]|nr:hypothetical protein [Candidatus Zymogenaceae bacterium]